MKEKLSEDLQVVTMDVATEGVRDTVALLALPDALELELRGFECEFHSGLDELDQGLQGLNMYELREELQKLEEQIMITLIQREEESEATDRSFDKGSGKEDAATILSSSPPIKPTKTPDKFQNVISNTVTPEAARNTEAKTLLLSKTPTKLLQPTKNYNSGFPTINPTKLSTNLPTKVLKVNVIKPSTNEAKVSTYNQDQLFH